METQEEGMKGSVPWEMDHGSPHQRIMVDTHRHSLTLTTFNVWQLPTIISMLSYPETRFSNLLDLLLRLVFPSSDVVALQEVWVPDKRARLSNAAHIHSDFGYCRGAHGSSASAWNQEGGLLTMVRSVQGIEDVSSFTPFRSGASGTDRLGNKGFHTVPAVSRGLRYWVVNTHLQSIESPHGAWDPEFYAPQETEIQARQLVELCDHVDTIVRSAPHSESDDPFGGVFVLGDFNFHFTGTRDEAEKDHKGLRVSPLYLFLRERGWLDLTESVEDHPTYSSSSSPDSEDQRLDYVWFIPAPGVTVEWGSVSVQHLGDMYRKSPSDHRGIQVEVTLLRK